MQPMGNQHFPVLRNGTACLFLINQMPSLEIQAHFSQ
jgi:hypothetical protein